MRKLYECNASTWMSSDRFPVTKLNTSQSHLIQRTGSFVPTKMSLIFVGHGRRLNEQRTPFCVLRHNSNSHISLTTFSDIGLSETLGCISWMLFFYGTSPQKKFLVSSKPKCFSQSQLFIDSYCNCIVRHHNIKQKLWVVWSPFLIWISLPAYSRSSTVIWSE